MDHIDSLITGGIGILVCLINNIYQNSRMRSLMDYRMNLLEEKVNKHNNLIERTYELEKQEDILEHRVYTLENSLKKVSNQ